MHGMVTTHYLFHLQLKIRRLITEWGRYRYISAPQGFHVAGDGYTKRHDDIIAEVERKAECIDDSLLWDTDIEQSFWHTIDYIILCNTNGITFNKDKFHFAKDEGDFAGFTTTSDGIMEKMLAAIRDFPTPTNVTGSLHSFSVSLTRYRTFSLVRKKCNHFGSYLKKTLNGIGTRH